MKETTKTTKYRPFIIGVAGAARTGKDTFANFLIRELHYKHDLSARRIAFADQMKKDCEGFLLSKCGLDIWNDQDKVKARGLLVWFGSVFMREKSKGQHWINCIKKKIDACSAQNDLFVPPHKDIFIIPDVRFKEYEYDEMDYIKENGILVYIDKFKYVSGNDVFQLNTPPANEHEAKNNVILKKGADYKIEWADCDGDNDKINKICLPEVQNFILWMKEQKYIDG